MANTYTGRLGLAMPAQSDRGWNVPVNANAAAVDSTFLGGLYVQTAQIPSTSLGVVIAAGSYIQNSGLIAAYAGGSLTLAAASTTYLWLTDTGTLTTGSAWPTTNHIRLAVVATGATTVTTITDSRVPCRAAGYQGLTVYEGGAAPRMGVATLVGGTVTVNTTSVTTTSRIFLTVQTTGGTPGFLAISSKVAGTSFAVTSSSSTDTSTIAWMLVQPG